MKRFKKPSVLLVASLSQAARLGLVQAHLSTRGADQSDSRHKILWLDNQDWPVELEEPRPDQSFVACACCSGSVVFSTYLTRLLRGNSADRLILTLSSRAEPRRVMAMLSGAPWCEVLGAVRLVSVLDERAQSFLGQPDHAFHDLVRQQQDLSWRVLKPDEPLPADPFAGL